MLDAHRRSGTFIVVDPLVVKGSSSPTEVEGRLCLEREYPYVDEIERGFYEADGVSKTQKAGLNRAKMFPLHPLSLIYDMHTLELIYTPRMRTPSTMFPHDEAWLKSMPGWGRQQVSTKWLDALVRFGDLTEVTKTNGMLFAMDAMFVPLPVELLAIRWEFRAMFRKVFSRLGACEALMVWSKGGFFPELIPMQPAPSGSMIPVSDDFLAQKGKSELDAKVKALVERGEYKDAVMAAYCCMRGTKGGSVPTMRMYCHLVHTRNAGFGGTSDTFISDPGKVFKGDKGWTCGEIHMPIPRDSWVFSGVSTLRSPERELSMLLGIQDDPNGDDSDEEDDFEEEEEALEPTTNKEEKP